MKISHIKKGKEIPIVVVFYVHSCTKLLVHPSNSLLPQHSVFHLFLHHIWVCMHFSSVLFCVILMTLVLTLLFIMMFFIRSLPPNTIVCSCVRVYVYLYSKPTFIHHLSPLTKYQFNSLLFHRIFSCFFFSHSLFLFSLYLLQTSSFHYAHFLSILFILFIFFDVCIFLTSVVEVCLGFHTNLEMSCLIRTRNSTLKKVCWYQSNK